MMRRMPISAMLTVVAVIATFTLFGGAVRAQQKAEEKGDEAKRISEATTVFSEIMGAPDKAVPQSVLGKAAGIAIFPSTIKAGFVVGGMHGRGIVSARHGGAWSAPAFLTLTGGSFGLQIGGEAADLILVIQNERGLENLFRNQFKVGADAAAAAGPVGRDTQASTDIQMRAQILSYSRARGLFAGITVDGSTIAQDKDANERFYGKPLTTKEVVSEKPGRMPEPVAAWRAALQRYAK
jgi:lipid-binding SYLF domain-containing protein